MIKLNGGAIFIGPLKELNRIVLPGILTPKIMRRVLNFQA
jgi:hypothetical protein